VAVESPFHSLLHSLTAQSVSDFYCVKAAVFTSDSKVPYSRTLVKSRLFREVNFRPLFDNFQGFQLSSTTKENRREEHFVLNNRYLETKYLQTILSTFAEIQQIATPGQPVER
jgi:hypothetical protein